MTVASGEWSRAGVKIYELVCECAHMICTIIYVFSTHHALYMYAVSLSPSSHILRPKAASMYKKFMINQANFKM